MKTELRSTTACSKLIFIVGKRATILNGWDHAVISGSIRRDGLGSATNHFQTTVPIDTRARDSLTVQTSNSKISAISVKLWKGERSRTIDPRFVIPDRIPWISGLINRRGVPAKARPRASIHDPRGTQQEPDRVINARASIRAKRP